MQKAKETVALLFIVEHTHLESQIESFSSKGQHVQHTWIHFFKYVFFNHSSQHYHSAFCMTKPQAAEQEARALSPGKPCACLRASLPLV